LSNHLTQDSVGYIYNAISGEELIHPHHLLYNFLMRIIVVLMDGAQLETVVAALQYANIVITLLTVWLVWLVVRRIGAPVWASAIYTIFFALSSGILVYSSQTEVYTITVLFLAVAVFGLVYNRSPIGPVFVAVGWFGAMLFHQTAIFFGAALVVHELLNTGRHSLRRLAFVVGLPLTAIGVVYLAACRLHNHRTAIECWNWITSYGHSDSWGKGTVSYDTFRLGLGSMLEALNTGRGRYALGLLVLFVIVSIVNDRRHLIANKDLVVGCMAWCVVQGAFAMWFFAANVEFWICILLPLTFCLAAVAHSYKHVSQCVLKRILISVPIILTIALSVLAACNHFQLNSRPNHLLLCVVQCADVVTQQDTVVTADNKLRQYCRLYLNNDHIIAFNGPIARQAIQASDSNSFTQNLLDVLAVELRKTQKRGGKLFVDQRIVQGTLNQIRLMRDFEPEVFSRDIVRQFNISPLGIQDARWYEFKSIAEDTATPAFSFESYN